MSKIEEVLDKYETYSFKTIPETSYKKEDMVAIIREACEEQKKLCAANATMDNWSFYDVLLDGDASYQYFINKDSILNCPNIADQ